MNDVWISAKERLPESLNKEGKGCFLVNLQHIVDDVFDTGLCRYNYVRYAYYDYKQMIWFVQVKTSSQEIVNALKVPDVTTSDDEYVVTHWKEMPDGPYENPLG